MPGGPWVSVDDVAEAVRSRLGVDQLAGRWPKVISDAVTEAAELIQTTLLGMTYTAAQIDAWDHRVSHNRAIAVLVALINAGDLTHYKLADLQASLAWRLKRITDLNALSIGGVLVSPAATTADGEGMAVAGGQMDQTTWPGTRLDTHF